MNSLSEANMASASEVEEEVTNGLYLLLGLSLGFAAEFWVGMASIQIKYSHKLDAVSENPRPAYKRPRWWFGFSLYIMNVLFNFGSYMFASLNVLAPTSALVIIINAILARIYFNERLTCFGYIGSAFIMIGCVLCILFGTHDQDELDVSNLYDNASTLKFIIFTSVHGLTCVVFGVVGATNLGEGSSKSAAHKIHPDVSCGATDPEILYSINNNAPSDKAHDVYSREDIDESNQHNKGSNDMSGIGMNVNEQIDEDEETPVEDQHDSTPLIRAVTPDETSAIIPKSKKKKEEIQDEWKHIVRCFLLAFATAGVVAWVQFFGKIGADIIFQTVEGNNQFDNLRPFGIGCVLAILLVFELYLLSEMMRMFDAVLVIPVYNSLMILTTIALSGVYWDNFVDWSVRDTLLFVLGLVLIFSGIGSVCHGQKHESMANLKGDNNRNYVSVEEGGVSTKEYLKSEVSDRDDGHVNPKELTPARMEL